MRTIWLRVWFSLLMLLSLLACEAGDDDDNNATDDDDDDNNDDNDNDNDDTAPREIDVATLEDKILGSWVGQMAGVAWAAPTEFNYTGRIIPDDQVPQWQPGKVNNGFLQDDIYVEVPFLQAMWDEGVGVGWDVFGAYFRDTVFPLWHANEAGRDNLRDGLPVPDAGHYSHNEHCDDIDWQIEADFIGAMCPGLVNEAVDVAWRAGHVMNFGDGVYGGVFMAAMHAASFFAADVAEIIDAGRVAVPEGSEYRAVIEDVLAWHEAGHPWEETWQLLQDKWGDDDRCPSYDNPLMRSFNIDAKLNGAYVLIGLLYGDGEIERSMRIAMRCGQDSDCNPSTVGGILGNWLGLAGIPDKFKSALQSDRKFLFTSLTLDDAIAMSVELSRAILQAAGATASGSGADEIWTLPPVQAPRPPILEQWPNAANDLPALTAIITAQEARLVEFEAHATDADGILDYEWYFGDLQRARGAVVSHEYAAAGTYQVLAYATDAIGNTAVEVLTVDVP